MLDCGFVTAALLLQCILGDVLAHRINVSYDQFIGEVVSAVNGPFSATDRTLPALSLSLSLSLSLGD